MQIPEYTTRVKRSFVPAFRGRVDNSASQALRMRAREAAYEGSRRQREIGFEQFLLNTASNLVSKGVNYIGAVMEAKVTADMMKAETELTKRSYDFFNKIDDPQNTTPYKEWPGMAQESLQQWHDEILDSIDSRGAKKAFEEAWPSYSNEFMNKVNLKTNEALVYDMKANYLKGLDTAIKSNNFVQAMKFIKGAEASRLITPEQAYKDERDAREQIATGIIQNTIKSLGYEGGISFLKNEKAIERVLRGNGLEAPDFTDEAKNKIEKQLKSEWDIVKKQQAEQEKQIFEREQERLWDLFRENKLTPEEIDRAQIPAVSGGEGDKMWWQGKLDAKIKADKGVEKVNAKHNKYNAEYDRINNTVNKLIESGETEKADEIIDQIQKSKLKEGDQGILTSRINNWRKGIEEDIRIDEYLDAKDRIESGEITKIEQISNSKKYEHLSLADIKSLESSLKTKIKAENPNYISDPDKKAELDRLILQGRKEEALDFLRKNTGADKDGNPGISLKEAGKYKDELLKEREEAVKNATKEGIDLIDSTFKQMMKVAEDPKDRYDIETAQKRLITNYREMITDDMEPAEVVQKAKDMLDVENVATVSNMLEDAHSGWFGKKKREQAMEAVKAMGLNDAEIAKQDFKEFMGAEPGRVGKDKEGNTVVQYNNDLYGLIDGVWKIWNKDKEKWLKYRK